MGWRVNAFCPHGRLTTVDVNVDGRLDLPAPCTCGTEDPVLPGRLRRWLELRRFRRQIPDGLEEQK